MLLIYDMNLTCVNILIIINDINTLLCYFYDNYDIYFWWYIWLIQEFSDKCIQLRKSLVIDLYQ